MTAREEILARVRQALGRSASSPTPAVPGRMAARVAAERDLEIDALVAEIRALGGQAQRLARSQLPGALAELVAAENIRKATLWSSTELQAEGVEARLRDLGVEIVPAQADKAALAGCDLGISGADAALAETGTLLLRSTPERPRAVSLLPRIHLAIVDPSVFCPDLGPALEGVKGEGYWVLVTGPSRTADIEMTVTIGVHGPQALHVWVLDEG